MPVAWSLRSTNIFGWPQLALSIYGPDFMGRDVIRGYGTIHLPRKPGRHTLYIPLFTPDATTPVNGLLSYFAGKLPEFIDPKFVTRADGREGTLYQLLSVVRWTHIYSNACYKFGRGQSHTQRAFQGYRELWL